MHMWFPSIESHHTTLIGEATKREIKANILYIGEATKREIKVDFTRPFFLEGCRVVRSFNCPYVKCGEPPCMYSICVCVCVCVFACARACVCAYNNN